MRLAKIFYLLILLLAIQPPSARAGDELLVAVASNFIAPMREIAAAFEQHTGHKVTLASGSSGKLYAQIRHGAPFDVFLSADDVKPKALEAGGYALPDSRFTYALGGLALWSPDSADPKGLLHGDFARLALANPRVAPYGQAAQSTLASLGLLERTRDRWVQGENIAQTYQFVASGNADLGFVALSQLTSQSQRSGIWQVPPELHPPIRQDAVAILGSSKPKLSSALLCFLKSDSTAEILSRYGYSRP